VSGSALFELDELLAARRVDHCKQFFSGIDFGFSKTAEERHAPSGIMNNFCSDMVWWSEVSTGRNRDALQSRGSIDAWPSHGVIHSGAGKPSRLPVVQNVFQSNWLS